MLFNYKAVTKDGEEKTGTIEAVNEDIAISSLQRRELIVVAVSPVGKTALFERDIAFLTRISIKDVVILSRQIATLFEAQVPALKAFRMLAEDVDNSLLQKKLHKVADDIQSGMSISQALSKHPSVFSEFYVNMIHAGEESGKLSDSFTYLADYLDRYYELLSKTRNALAYPAFVVLVFIAVMVLMFTWIVPKLSVVLIQTGQELPLLTKIVIGMSNIFVNYWWGVVTLFILIGIGIWYLMSTGVISFSRFKLSVPLFGTVYSKLYLARISDNMYTMLSSGISMVKALEVTATVVGNQVYQRILEESTEAVKGGRALSEAFSEHEEIPKMMVQIVKVGEESGALSEILRKLAFFYKREVDNAVDTLISLIEPILIVLLGLGVFFIFAAVIIPIYNVAGGV